MHIGSLRPAQNACESIIQEANGAMEQSRRGGPPVNPPILETEDLISATECTGLTPAAVQTPGEAHAYAKLYAIHEQKPAWEHDDRLGASCGEWEQD